MRSSFSIIQLKSMASSNIKKLYTYAFKTYYSQDDLLDIKTIAYSLTNEEIQFNGSHSSHPILHEICEQVQFSFPMLQIMWQCPIFESYWDNSKYRDKYGNTVFQRLSSTCYNSQYIRIDIINWIKDNMGIIPSESN